VLIAVGFVIFIFASKETPPRIIVLFNGTIHTVDPGLPVTHTLVVRDGIFHQVGIPEDELRAEHPNADWIDLKGQLVVPGLVDSHAVCLELLLPAFIQKIKQRTAPLATRTGNACCSTGWLQLKRHGAKKAQRVS
jgi:hypothetical protein